MPKFITVEEAVKLIPDGATVMFGLYGLRQRPQIHRCSLKERR